MSYNVAALLHDVTDTADSGSTNANLEDTIDVKQSGISNSSREKPCSYDICCFNKLNEAERNPAPGFSMPYRSWMIRPPPFLHMNSHLAPRTEYEQPYWYRPDYFGWQNFTGDSQVSGHQSAFLKLQNGSSTIEYHTTGYQIAGCHAGEYQITGYHARGYESAYGSTHARGYESACGCTHARADESAYGCHARKYQTNQYLATGYQALDCENRLARKLGGLAYDHGEFPKILSVHSMAESNETVQKYYAIPSDFAKTDTNVAGPLHGSVPVTRASPCNDNLTSADEPYGNKDCGENAGGHSSHSSSESSRIESKMGCGTVAENRTFTNYYTSTILSCKRQIDSQNSQAEDDSHPRIPVGATGGHETRNSGLSCTDGYEREKEWPNAISKDECKRTNALSKSKESSDGTEPTKLAESSPNPAPESDYQNEEATFISASKARKLSPREQMAQIKKKQMILERIQKLKYIQTSFKVCKKSQSGGTRLLKKMAILKKEIEYLSNGEWVAGSSIQEKSPSNSTPVKMSLSTPNKDVMTGTRETAEQPAKIRKKRSTMEDSSNDEGMDGKFSGRDMERINVFEKLELLHGQNKLSSETSSSAFDGSGMSFQASHVERECGEKVSEVVSKSKCEGCSSQFTVVNCEDIQELNGNGQILVKSVGRNAGETLQKENNSSTRDELPNSWSSAYVFENQSRQRGSVDSLKRKETDDHVLYKETTVKRRCKAFPRKIVPSAKTNDFGRAFDADVFFDETPLQEQESEGWTEEWKNPPTIAEMSDDTESTASGLETVEYSQNTSNTEVVGSHEASKTSTELITPRVYDDDTLQRKHEIRESKIHDLIRKQEGLLQVLGKMASKLHPGGKVNSMP